jgi:hypothetical protein
MGIGRTAGAQIFSKEQAGRKMSVLTPSSSVWLALTAVQAAGMANETASSSRQG